MHVHTLSASFSLFLATLLSAQETYWVGGSDGCKQVDASGALRQTVLPTSTRNIGVAPDGKVWLVASGVTVLNADGTPFRTIAPSAGISPYAIAFDAQGHAWVSGGTGVEEFDAAGNTLGVIPLAPATAPLGITVDAQGNKWIAHRSGPPGTVSRIDATTRAVTNHPMPATSAILPVNVYADARGTLNPSHIWVVGDNRGAGELIELDATGTVLNTYVLDQGGRFGTMAGDVDATGVIRNIWVADWGNGNLHIVNASTGAPTTLPQGTGAYGVTFDGFGNVWATIRTGGLLRRIDPATGTLEVESAVAATTLLSTRWQHATVVDQLGDLDSDGVPNLVETTFGSSPFDACSTPNASLSVQGPTQIGANTAIAVQAAAGAVTGITFAAGSTTPGIRLPGIGCSFQLDLSTLIGVTIVTTGSASVPLTIPNNVRLIGAKLAMQGLNATALTFTNVAAMLLW